MRPTRLLRSAALAGSLALTATTLAATAAVPATATASPAAQECRDSGSAARVREGTTAKEPKLYPDNQANAYGALKDQPRMPNGSVHIRTVFHVISDHTLTAAENTRMQTMINAQMKVLNDSYSGTTSRRPPRTARSGSTWPRPSSSSTRPGTRSPRARPSAT